MTEKLYDINSHFKEFTATVTACDKKDNRYVVCLDKTAFFPEGGGQNCDTGTMNNALVTDVQILNGEIYHFTDRSFIKGQTVSCIIDWSKRFRNMQNHSGEHIISGIIHRFYGYDNVGFHLGDDMTADFNGQLTFEELLNIELLANEAIYKNVKFKTYYPSSDELSKLNYRSKLDLHDNVRIVEIDGYDTCACCAPHVDFSGEIGLIKILDSMRLRGGTRIFIKCGKDALCDYNSKYRNALKISNLLSVKQNEISTAVQKLADQNNELKYNLSQLKKQLINRIVENFDSNDFVTAIFEDGLDIKETQLLSNAVFKKCGGLRAVFSGQNNNLCFAICADSELLDNFFIMFKNTFNVRGGGRNGIVQGTVQAPFSAIDAFFTKNKAFNLTYKML